MGTCLSDRLPLHSGCPLGAASEVTGPPQHRTCIICPPGFLGASFKPRILPNTTSAHYVLLLDAACSSPYLLELKHSACSTCGLILPGQSTSGLPHLGSHPQAARQAGATSTAPQPRPHHGAHACHAQSPAVPDPCPHTRVEDEATHLYTSAALPPKHTEVMLCHILGIAVTKRQRSAQCFGSSSSPQPCKTQSHGPG